MNQWSPGAAATPDVDRCRALAIFEILHASGWVLLQRAPFRGQLVVGVGASGCILLRVIAGAAEQTLVERSDIEP